MTLKEIYTNANKLDFESFKQIMENDSNIFIIDDFASFVAEDIQVTKSTLTGKANERGVVDARHIAMKYYHEEKGLTLSKTGEFFNRTHAAVLHAINKIDDIPELKKRYLKLVARWKIMNA